MNKKKIFISGHEGTTGLRIWDRMAERNDIELIKIAEDKRKDMTEIVSCCEQADIVFMCLPDDAAKETIAAAGHCQAKFIDTSTAHRTNPDWAYGFPELSEAYKEKVMTNKFVAVPGCHASGFISLVYPLVAAGLLPKDYPLACISLTGYSGGGKKMIAQYEGAERSNELDAPRQYGLGQTHKHLKEMKHVCGLELDTLFSPIVADYYSGMEVTVPLHGHLLKEINGGKVTLKDIWSAYDKHYQGAKMVKVLPFDPAEQNALFLNANKNSGYDDMYIYVTGNDDRIMVHSVFDNLGKGASGAAVQCMNIMLGLPEETGLAIHE